MRRVLRAAVLAIAATAVLAGPVRADGPLTIREIDTSGFPKVVVSALSEGAAPDLSQFHLREGGRIVDRFDVVPMAKSQTPIGVVLVLDTSGSMAQSGKMAAARSAARRFVDTKQPTDQIALVAFSDRARVVAGFTTDAGVLNKALDSLAAGGETALWDGVHAAASLFRDKPGVQPNVVLLSDGRDTASKHSATEAATALLAQRAIVFGVGLAGGDFSAGPVQGLAAATKGRYAETSDPSVLAGLYGQVQQVLRNQYQVTYTSSAPAGQRNLEIELTAGGQRATATAKRNDPASRASVPQAAPAQSRGPGFLQGGMGQLVIVLLVLAAAGLATLAVAQLVVKPPTSLDRALDPYKAAVPGDHEVAGGGHGLAETAIVQRAVEATARLAADRGLLARLESLLDQAAVPLRAAEVMFFNVAIGGVFGALAFVLTKSWLLAFTVLLLAALAPIGTLKFLAGRRRRKFTSQLPDTLQLLAGSLRAGYSLLQGLETVAQEVGDPMGAELRRILPEARLGRLLEDAMEDTAKRMGSPDFDWAVMAIRIQREVGGNLAELLSTVAETMIARERIRREVRALTAEGRISAVILGLMPVAIGLAFYVMNPDYIMVLFTRTMGQVMIAGSAVVGAFGFWWMKKTVDIKV